jgi:MCP family monocarboxylic acid transporter-like MFS transporter 10
MFPIRIHSTNTIQWAAVRGFGTRGSSQSAPSNGDVSDQPLQTFWLLTIMNGASTVGRLTLAQFSDKTGPLNMHMASQFVCSLLTLILWSLAGSETDAIAFCVVFGVFSGMVIGLPPASIANILSCSYTAPGTEVLAKKKLGHWVGMMYSFAAIPALVGPIIAGHLITEFQTYITVQMWSGTNLMLSFFCMVVARWYLPCYDGESFPAKATHMLNKRNSNSTTEKGRAAQDNGYGQEPFSQAPTQVPSRTPSFSASREKSPAHEAMV